ncbi:MAG: TonB-dependent receptor, partial [Ignavibacteriaceae bacterium]
FTSTTSNGVTIKPNSNLKPEKNFNFEVGANYQISPKVNFDLSIFQNELYDFIEPGVDLNDGRIIFKNVTRARIQGIELDNNYIFFNNSLKLNLSYSYLWARDINKNKFLKYRPRHSALIEANYKFNQYQFGAAFRYFSKVEEIDFELIDLGVIKDGDKRVAVYVIDLNAGYDFNFIDFPLKIYLNVKNLLNYNYVELIGNLEPPRNISLSLELNF